MSYNVVIKDTTRPPASSSVSNDDIGPFSNKQKIKSVDLCNVPFANNSMAYAFYGCRNLTTITNMNQNVTNMKDTFSMSGLKTPVNVPYGVTDINRTFYSCEFTNEVPVIPNTVIYMEGTFNYCSNMTVVPEIPNSVTVLNETFAYCNKLVDGPTIPNSVSDMNETFFNCGNLVNTPIIPDSVVNMNQTFSQCRNLVNVNTIGNGVISMSSTFYHCYNLVNAPIIPNNVNTMRYTFAYCTNLVNAPIIPNNVTNMYGTFVGCAGLTGDIIIQSSNVIQATNCFNNTTLTKNVYIPFNSTTYNTFINAGYDTNGTTNGVYLKDINEIN